VALKKAAADDNPDKLRWAAELLGVAPGDGPPA